MSVQTTPVDTVYRSGSTLKAYIGRSSVYLHDTEMTYLGDSTGSQFTPDCTYTIIENDPYRPADHITVENVETGERFDVLSETLERQLLANCFKVHNWR
jgi:hypothetical protein